MACRISSTPCSSAAARARLTGRQPHRGAAYGSITDRRDNEPYRIEAAEDYTVPVHGGAPGVPAALIEVGMLVSAIQN